MSFDSGSRIPGLTIPDPLVASTVRAAVQVAVHKSRLTCVLSRRTTRLVRHALKFLRGKRK